MIRHWARWRRHISNTGGLAQGGEEAHLPEAKYPLL
jgi:hypothetical protein